MTRRRRQTDPARGRVIVLSVVVGVLIVLAAAAGATAFVKDDPPRSQPVVAAPSSPGASSTPHEKTTDSAGPPTTPAPAPSIPGTDRLGFIGTAARCADGDAPRMMVLTAASRAVVCDRAGALYYAGWRTATASGTHVDGLVTAGPGWIANAPDATITIAPSGLVFSTASGEFAEPATGFWAG